MSGRMRQHGGRWRPCALSRCAVAAGILLCLAGGALSAGSVTGRSGLFLLGTKDASIGEPALSAAIAARSGLFAVDTRAGVQRSGLARSPLFTVDTLVNAMSLVVATGGDGLPGVPAAMLTWSARTGNNYRVEIMPVWESMKPTYPFSLITGNPDGLVRVWKDWTDTSLTTVELDLSHLGLLSWNVGGNAGGPRDWATQFPAGRYDVTVINRGPDGTGTEVLLGPIRLHRYHVWKQAGSAAARPLLFVNGWVASSASTARSAMTDMADDFAADHACYLLEYGDTDDHALYNVPALAGAVNLIRAAHPGKPVDMICHSAGGLLARYYKHELHHEAKVGKIVCLGTPHRGSPLAETGLAAFWDGYGALADDTFKPLTRMLRNPQQPNLPNAAYRMTKVNNTAFQLPFTADDAERQDIIFVAGRRKDIAIPGVTAALLQSVAYLYSGKNSLSDSDGVVPFTSAAYTPADAGGVRCLSLELNHLQLNNGLAFELDLTAPDQQAVHDFISRFLDGDPTYVRSFGRFKAPTPPMSVFIGLIGVQFKGGKAGSAAAEAGAVVLREQADGSLVLLGVTGNDGRAELQLDRGTHYDLSIVAVGYEPAALALDVPLTGTLPEQEVSLALDLSYSGPRSASMHINGDDSVTTARGVTLTLACRNADEMRLSESPIFGDDPAWVVFTDSAPFMLDNVPGPHTVFAEFRNSTGDPGQTVLASAAITYQDPAQNLPPAMPEQLSPGYAAPDLGLTPMLVASAFSDPDGDTHAHSQWQVDEDSAFGSPAWDSGSDNAPATQAAVPAGSLDYTTTYSWRVRYQDSRDAWSDWSPGRPFTTFTPQCETPGFAPSGGPLLGPTANVTVTCGTSGATIHYTTTGVDPAEADPTVASGGTVIAPVPGTLKAGAWKTDWLPSAIATVSYTQQNGSVTCTLMPEAVRALGAQWRLTAGLDTGWKNSGDAISGLPLLGNPYTVTFSSVVGWISPPDQPVPVSHGGTSTLQGDYTLRTYAVTFEPGAHGSLAGGTPALAVTVNHGDPAPAAPTVTSAVGWAFRGWSPVLPATITGAAGTTAQYARTTYTLTYLAGEHGAIDGTTPQTVEHGSDGATVTATSATGYHFVQWSDGLLTAARTQTNVTADLTVTATFAINRYTVTFQPGAHGTLAGGTPAVTVAVNHGDPAPAAPTVTPAVGWSFTGWTPALPATITADAETTAQCARVTYTLTYLAGPNGSVTGTTPQTVNHGSSGTAVTATPAVGYHFVQWSDGALSAARTATSVTANLTVTASFAINAYTLTFAAGPGGSVAGATPQTVPHGGSTTAVAAVADYGFMFTQWADGMTTNPRILTNVTAAVTRTASFRAANSVAPNGSFLAVLGAADVAGGRGLWDLTGTYTTTVAGNPLTLNVLEDTRGRLTGTATMQVTTAKAVVPVTMPIRGSASGTNSVLVATMTMQGAVAANAVRVSLSLRLTLNAATRQLVGRTAGSIKVGASPGVVDEIVSLSLPVSTDGAWTLLFQLTSGSRAVTGTATLRLANGAAYLFTVRGRIAGQKVAVSLAWPPTDVAAKGISINTTITPLEGGWARLESVSLRGCGQVLGW